MHGDLWAAANPATLRAALAVVALVIGLAPRARAQTPPMPGMPEMSMKDMRWQNTLFVLLERFEYSPGNAARPVFLDGRLWYGGAYQRVWLRTEGDQTTALGNNVGEGDAQLLYGRLVAPYWDAVIGVRVDQSWGAESDGRAHLAIGFIGLSPYRFELEPTLFISQTGDVSARFEAEFPVLITQKLVAEPLLEVNAALQGVPRFGVRSGLNDYELGLRIRYEFRRELAPYVGWSRTRRFGSGGEVSGEPSSNVGTRLVVGIRLWR